MASLIGLNNYVTSHSKASSALELANSAFAKDLKGKRIKTGKVLLSILRELCLFNTNNCQMNILLHC